MPHPHLRPAEAAQLPELLELWLAGNCSAHHFLPAALWQQALPLVEQLLPQSTLLVYCEGEQLLGFAGLEGDHLSGLFVRAEAQGRGIGSQLLHHLQQQHDQLSLEVFAKNQRALRFYERAGFAICAQRQNADFQNELEYVLCWPAPPAPEAGASAAE